MLRVVENQDAGEELLVLDEIARMGARRMLMTALKCEADSYEVLRPIALPITATR
jgi:hypothetical protein